MTETKDLYLSLSEFEKAILTTYVIGCFSDKTNFTDYHMLDIKFPMNKVGYEAIKKKISQIVNKEVDEEYIKKSVELCVISLFGMVLQFAALGYDSKNDIDPEYRQKINEVLQRTIDDFDFLPHTSTTIIKEAKVGGNS